MAINDTARTICAFSKGMVLDEKVSAPMAATASQPSSLIGTTFAVTF